MIEQDRLNTLSLAKLASLIAQRNGTEQDITQITGRPAAIGHLGEYIASTIFGITLVESACNKGFDGHFAGGTLQGKSVNAKWYARDKSLLDITPNALPDMCLVLTGPRGGSTISRGATRPWLIDAVYLFDAIDLVDRLRQARVKLNDATSVRRALWQAAQVYPESNNDMMALAEEQRHLLAQFSSTRR